MNNMPSTTLTQFNEEESSVTAAAADVSVLQVAIKRTGASESSTLKLSIDRDATVRDLKRMIEREILVSHNEIMPPERQRLICSGRMLSNDDEQLLSVIKMKNDAVNYIHLAPLPKGATPALRKQQASDFGISRSDLPRLSSHSSVVRREHRRRSSRAYSPYPEQLVSYSQRMREVDSETEVGHRVPLASELLMNSSFLHQQELSSPVYTTPLAVLPVDMAVTTSTTFGGINPVYIAELERTVLHDVAALLPLSRVLPGSLYQVAGEGSLPDTGGMVLLLEQIAHRSMILSLSLRSMDQARRMMQQQQQQQYAQQEQLMAAAAGSMGPDLAVRNRLLNELEGLIGATSTYDGGVGIDPSLLGPFGYH
jgi:hypothetical protein